MRNILNRHSSSFPNMSICSPAGVLFRGEGTSNRCILPAIHSGKTNAHTIDLHFRYPLQPFSFGAGPDGDAVHALPYGNKFRTIH